MKQVDFDSAIRRFESSRPSQPVRCPAFLQNRLRNPRQLGPFLLWGASLRVPDGTGKESFRLSVSESHFRCLVFGLSTRRACKRPTILVSRFRRVRRACLSVLAKLTTSSVTRSRRLPLN